MIRSALVLTAVLLALSGPLLAAPYSDPERRTPVVRAVERASPAVVNIATTKLVQVRDPLRDWFGRFEGMRPRSYKAKSVGSGVIVHPDGYVVTNSHVVRRATDIAVILDFGGEERKYECTVLGQDPANDLALLKLEGNGPFPVCAMGSSDTLMIGEPAIAVGNPFGVGKTVTTGVISALRRSVSVRSGARFEDFIQTDAAINPGNSGGPLLNIKGEMIGVNTAIIPGGEGLGFAIPVDRVSEILPALIEKAVLNVNLGFRPVAGARGVTVRTVDPDGASAALRPGDVIKMVDGRPVRDLFDLATPLLQKTLGDVIRLSVLRGEERVRVDLELPLTEEEQQIRRRAQYVLDRMGLVGEDLPEAARLQGVTGALVRSVGGEGPAARVKIRPGDVIVALGRYRVKSLEELAAILKKTPRGTTVDLQVNRQRRRLTGSITLR